MLTGAKPLFLLLVQSRGTKAQVGFVVVALASAWFAGMQLQGVPLVESRSVFLVSWLSAVPGLYATGLLAPPSGREATLPRMPLGMHRLCWVLGLAALPVLLMAPMVLLQDGDAWRLLWFARNHLLVLGIGLLSAALLPPSAAWAPGAAYVLFSLFLGTSDEAGTAQWWALPNHLPDQWPAWLCAVALVVCGAAMSVWRPARAS